jgi:LTXXQ motif family protein
MAASGPGEIMKTRDITMLCAAMVVGTASTTAPATVAAATLRAPVMLAQAAPAPAATPRMQAAASKASTVDPVEARIKDLHTRLKITSAQEDLWNKAAQMMRENATAMDALRKARTEKTQTMTAVDDFKSYGEMAEAHADGIRKFVPVFSALYDSMSDAQKKNADTIFRRGSGQKASK